MRGFKKILTVFPKQGLGQIRTNVSGPPRNIVGWPEKLAHGAVMVFGTLIPAAYMLSNLQEYKKKAGADA